GKDSLHNQFTDSETGRVIRIPSTLLISAIGVIDDVRKCVTMDLKNPREGRLLLISPRGNSLADRIATHRAVSSVIRRGMVLSCHDVSEGGYLTAVAEMCIASGLGADLAPDDAEVLFAEPVGQYVIEVEAVGQSEVTRLIAQLGGEVRELGRTSSDVRLQIARLLPDRSQTMDLHVLVDDMTRAWRGTLDW
ncbi:MAG: purL 2, partial [Phycisphaerales bacterium]|nr:purL 2 [Phycisphaerales bacterium]